MPTKEISLFEHNEIAYQKLLNGLRDYPLALIEHATGTGKSFILLKYLYENCLNKRILFISMHDEMFAQLFDDQMSTLGIDRKEFKCFDTLIYPNIIKHDMKDIISRYDCIVFDEAHHCGAEKWSIKVKELKDYVLNTKGKMMIGATATKIRYLDDYTDVGEIYFDGHVVSRLPVSTSILKNLLPAPIYINSLTSCVEMYDRVARKTKRIPKNQETSKIFEDLDNIGKKLEYESSISHVLKKYNVSKGEKYIVFCSSIEDLKRKQKEASEWFKDIGPIKTFSAHSGQKKSKNMEEIAEFSKPRPEISLIFAVDIFNEGFHIDGVDGVFMFRKTSSPIVYFQQIGRALSFSVRKKQIKIFDFVDNISKSDVIYNLYKEMISDARRLASEDPDNRELYYEILKRFEIIDDTTHIIDELNAIEKEIDEKYINQTNIIYAIGKLEEYRNFYPNTNFKEELANNRLAKDYINAYNYICRMSDNLTIEEIERLNKLSIPFNRDISMPISKRKELLGSCQTIRELKEKEYKDFIQEYLSFYDKYGRRPTSSNDPYESNLNATYRRYLKELSPSKLTHLINQYPFSPSVEESVLTSNYPSKEMINLYILKIKEKINNDIPLDYIEIKVMRKLLHTISLKDTKLIATITNYNDINYKIESAIQTLENYQKNVDQNETFALPETLIGETEVYKAIRTINKYAERITTPQFEHLLSLNITLPKSINMSLEERISKLGKYSSFYEKNQNEGIHIINRYINFVLKEGRRPDEKNSEESELALTYQREISSSSTTKIREVCSILKSFNIELSFFEKIISGEKIDNNIIIIFIKNIIKKLSNYEEITDSELRLIRSIKRQDYDLNGIDLDVLITEITTIRDIDKLISELKKQISENKYFDKRPIIGRISSKSKFLTKKHIAELEPLIDSLPSNLKDRINSLNVLNIYAEEIAEREKFISALEEYLDTNHKRPPLSSKLDIFYRDYIQTLSRSKLTNFLDIFISRSIPLTFEEKILSSAFVPLEEQNQYIAEKKNKISSSIPLDSLEKRVLNIMRSREMFKKEDKEEFKPFTHVKKTRTLEEEALIRLRETISRNPKQVPNYDDSFFTIPHSERRKLEEYRKRLLARDYFTDLLSRLKAAKQPLTEILSIEEYDEYRDFSNLSNLDTTSSILLNTIKALDIDNRFLSKGLNHQKLIDSYISFITSHNGIRPSISSGEEDEVKLALAFKDSEKLLSPQDLSAINQAINNSMIPENPIDFYNEFYNFIINNGRFPCGNSDDPKEVRLNNLYVACSGSFTKEQLIELRKLKKVYSKATVKATLEFSKKQKLGYNKK